MGRSPKVASFPRSARMRERERRERAKSEEREGSSVVVLRVVGSLLEWERAVMVGLRGNSRVEPFWMEIGAWNFW